MRVAIRRIAPPIPLMKVPVFVMSSAAVLAVWLGVTFVREVPQDSYPMLGKGSQTVSTAEADKAAALISLDDAPETPVASVE